MGPIVPSSLRIAAILWLASGTLAVAAPRIPSSDLPGRERERFIDPPGARLLQPPEPVTTLPYGARPSGRDCRPRSVHRKQRSVRRKGC